MADTITITDRRLLADFVTDIKDCLRLQGEAFKLIGQGNRKPKSMPQAIDRMRGDLLAQFQCICDALGRDTDGASNVHRFGIPGLAMESVALLPKYAVLFTDQQREHFAACIQPKP